MKKHRNIKKYMSKIMKSKKCSNTISVHSILYEFFHWIRIWYRKISSIETFMAFYHNTFAFSNLLYVMGHTCEPNFPSRTISWMSTSLSPDYHVNDIRNRSRPGRCFILDLAATQATKIVTVRDKGLFP